jgi:hypothetical protein
MERGALRIDFRGQRYNIRVPPPDIHVPSPETQAGSSEQHRHAVYASEAIGLLLIALVLLVLGLVRYWHSIQWRLR